MHPRARAAWLVAAATAVAAAPPTPPAPTWPAHFSADFDVYMRYAGPYWKSSGGGHVLFSGAAPHSMHSAYDEFCPPMFDNVTEPFGFNFTCEFFFYGENETVYYTNPDGKDPYHPACCVFATGLGPPAQNFCDTCTFITSTSLHGSDTYWWDQPGTGFTYASYNVDGHPPASLWASLAPNVGVLQIDYTSFNTSALPSDAFTLPEQCYTATPCADNGLPARAQRQQQRLVAAAPGIVRQVQQHE